MKLAFPVWREGLCLALLAGGLVLVAGCVAGGELPASPTATLPTVTPVPTPTPWPLPARLSSPEYGVNLHVWWDRWAAMRDWRLVDEAGFTWVKQSLPWRDVEGERGLYDWWTPDQIITEAVRISMNVVLRLDRTPAWAAPAGSDLDANPPPADVQEFGTFCHAVATRYRGQVRGYQVWNEPNLAREWGGQLPDPAGYVALLRACYVGIKTADPQALVISAGLAPTGSGPPEAMPDTDFLSAMYEAGAAPYFDLLGLNAPGYAAPPEVSPGEAARRPEYGGHSFFCFRHVEEMRAIMEQYGDGAKQVAILEFGWTTDPVHPAYSWFAVSPERQAEYLVRALRYARTHWSPWIGPLFVWNVPDPHWTPEHEQFWWGIVDPFYWEQVTPEEGGRLRPAYLALRAALTGEP